MTKLLRCLGMLSIWGLLPITPAIADVSALLRVAKSAPAKTTSDALDAEDFKSLKATTIDLARTRLVLDAALRSEGVAELSIVKGSAKPIDWLAERLSVRTSPDSEVVELRLAADGEEGVKLLDAVAHALVDQVNTLPREDHAAWATALRSSWQGAAARSRERGIELANLRKDLGAVEGDAMQIRSRLLQDRIADLRRTADDARLHVTQLESQIEEERRRGPEEALSEEELDAYLRQHPAVGPKYIARDQAALEVHDNSGEPGPTNEELRRRFEHFQRADQELRAVKEEHRAEATERVRSLKADTTLKSLRASLVSYQRIQSETKEEIGHINDQLLQLTDRSADIDGLAAETRREAAIVDELRQRIAEAEAWLLLPPRVTLLQSAAVAIERPE